MPKATIEFDLDSPEERQAHNRAIKSTDYLIFIFRYAEELRNASSYKDVKEKFWHLMEELNIDLNDLT